MNTSSSICLVGAGNMGGAMLAGWLESGVEPSRLTVIDPAPKPEMIELLSGHDLKAIAAASPKYQPDVLVIAVKPQMMAKVLPTLKEMVGPQTVCVSVAAGTTMAAMEQHLGNCAMVRAMPNTPALLRRGIMGCFANDRVETKQRENVDQLLHATGSVVWVDSEAQIDAVTAVSGSGPAYVFHLAECMAAAGVAEGLSEDVANQLARETIAGAGEMLSRLPEEASQLRKNVTSPNGTTAAALSVLMEGDAMAHLMAEAIGAARARSQELAEES